MGRTDLRTAWIPENKQTARAAGHVAPSSAELQIEGICTSTLSRVCMACTWTVVLYVYFTDDLCFTVLLYT